jgi:hypothetical protein
MSNRRDFNKLNASKLAQRRGTESADEPQNFMRPLLARRPPVQKPSKAQMSEEAAAAIAEWKRKQ